MLAEDRWPLVAAEIRAALDTHIVGREVYVLGQTTSTNDVARRLDRQGALEGTCVVAEYQTRGRGRFRRKWVARPREALLASALLRPDGGRDLPGSMTIMGALGVACAIQRLYGLEARIRWPNDLLVDDLKVAGILVERETDSAYVLGFGVNTGRPPEAPAAASLADLTGRHIDRCRLAVEIATELDHRYLTLLAQGIASLEEDWRALSCTLGRKVRLETGSRTYHGVVTELSAGALGIRFTSGWVRRFRSEHVRHLEVDEPAP